MTRVEVDLVAAKSTSAPDKGELFGTALAEEAHRLARRLDPKAQGLYIGVIEDAIEGSGARIRGDNPRSVLSSALNRQERMFRRTGRATWTWLAPAAGTELTAGLSGVPLADAAYALARRLDPKQAGIHYETLKERLEREGTPVRGPNRGHTFRGAIGRAPDRFEALGRGMYRWQ
jgi:hypothetical protein